MTVSSVAQTLIQYQSWLQVSLSESTATTSTATTSTEPGDAAAVGSDTAPTSPAESSSSSSVPTGVPAPPAAPPSTVVTLRHVVVNVTSATYQHLSIRAAAPTSPADSPDSSAASESSNGVAADSTPDAVASSAPTSNDSTSPSVVRLGADDFAKLRARSVDVGKQTALSLDLTTRDGDTIHLDFRQIDTFSRTWGKGETNDGTRVRASSTTASSQRYVNMAVNGNLSDDEKGAIDAVLQNVVEVANQFFHGDLRAAVAHLSDMNVDTNQLADVSLKMSMSRNRQLSQVAIGGGDAARVQQAAQASSGVGRTLEYLADQQKQLIVAAKTQFDDRSAVQLVKQLLPAMIAPPSTVVPNAPASSNDTSADVAASDAAPADTAASTSADSSTASGDAQTESAAPSDATTVAATA